MADNLAKLVERLEKVASRLENLSTHGSGSGAGPSSSGAGAAVEETPASVAQFDELVSKFVSAVVENCNKIGGDLVDIAKFVQDAFKAERDFLLAATKAKKPAPTDKDYQESIATMSKQLTGAAEYRNKKRTSELFNHLSAISEGLPAIGWVLQEPTPVPFIKEMAGASDFYSNKILVAKKGDALHTGFVKSLKDLFNELAVYVKANHTTGVTWNPRGVDFAAAKAAKPASSAPTAGGPPKAAGPPPPPPASLFTDNSSSSKSGAAEPDRSQLFASLNNPNITSGLKKVTSDMKTKNRTDRSGLVTDVPTKASTSAPKAAAKDAFSGTPKLALEDKKWVVEFQKDTRDLSIDVTDFKQAIYAYRCKNAFVKVNGKINSIQIDGCQGGGVQLDDAVASCEIVNSKGVSVQVLGKVPTFTIDKCSGINLYLSKASLDATIVTSMSESVNVNIPVEGSDDPVELPISEQFTTVVTNGKLVTTPNKHA